MTNKALTALACTTVILAIIIGGVAWKQRQLSATLSTKTETIALTQPISHLAIIMDGNRRWAKAQGMQPWKGHQSGIEPVKQTVEFCIEQGIPHLSLYTFSLENFNRSEQELTELFATIKKGLTNQEFKKLTEHGVRVRFIGDRTRFPDHLLDTITDIEQRTQNGSQLSLNLLFCYGGQQELASALQAIGTEIAQGTLHPSAITPSLIQNYLWSGDAPAPDLIIRTGGAQRLSNFLTWQSAYSELMFTKKYWPEITKQDLAEFLKNFEAIKRNFGT